MRSFARLTEALRRPIAHADRGEEEGRLTRLMGSSSNDQVFVLESCHSTWLFNTQRRQFCRILKNMGRPVATEWRAYDRLILHPESDAFVVILNASGTRLLRSWRHTAQCEQCGGNMTSEIALGDLERVASSCPAGEEAANTVAVAPAPASD
ncbi:MAG: hypothetical protein M0004_09100 [Actinomycetota bacterium]|nr:hypothetical protein [Actinomycetota bacterium]